MYVCMMLCADENEAVLLANHYIDQLQQLLQPAGMRFLRRHCVRGGPRVLSRGNKVQTVDRLNSLHAQHRVSCPFQYVTI